MFANNVVNRIYLTTNHTKLITIITKKTVIVINCSANLTVNKRYEAGVIITDQSLALEYLNSMNEMFNNAILLNPEE